MIVDFCHDSAALFLLLLQLMCSIVASQKSDGDPCTTKEGLPGECRNVLQCEWAVTQIENHRFPKLCGFRGDNAIVCCARTDDPSGLQPFVGDNDGGEGTRPPLPIWGNPTPSPTKPAPSPTKSPSVAKRIAEEKCREYSADVTQTIEALPLVPDPRPVSVTVPRCDISRLPLIVGGEDTKPGEFPHMAAVGFRVDGQIEWNCGGSLVSDQYVMTAAHCTDSRLGPPVRVRLGELNLKSDEDGAEPWDVDVAQVTLHPDYQPPAKYHDIALLRLAKRTKFSKFIRPACLFTGDQFPVNKTVATGWGRIDFAEQKSEKLLKVVLDIIDNNFCNERWRSAAGTAHLPQGITPSMLCAGVLKGGKDTCQGDSGGPIQITSEENKCIYHVIGITSFGKACAAKNSPGVYTRVANYIPWIESIVWR